MASDEAPIRERAQSWYDAPEEAALPARMPGTPLKHEPQTPRRWVLRVGLTAVCIVFAFSVIVHTEQEPPHALVMRDEATRVYLSPSCALGRGALPISSIALARRAGMTPDPSCEKSGGFLGASQTVLQETFAYLYLHPKRGSRWRPDGTWKW